MKIKMRLFEKINNYILEEYEKRLIKIINIFLYFKDKESIYETYIRLSNDNINSVDKYLLDLLYENI
ncbi:hypothetical protein [Clostridium perfringens]|uniref:hypothetical protein n=1 Tax=Clostridium perfringens TaxID=1502 RepID=UPI0024BC21E8|nr:hypothetical protein [Clostridium perfringens]